MGMCMSEAAAKVLVVDDLEDNRNVLSRHLLRMGCDVAMATNGREALESIHKDDYEIVLLDIMMPEVDGFEVIEKLRTNHEGKQPSIIAISARHDTDAITRALNMGANDYVTKPYDFPVVWARVEKQLNQSRSSKLIRDVNTRLVKRLAELREKENIDKGDDDAAVEAILREALKSAKRNDLKSKLNHEVRTRLHHILGLAQQTKSYDIERLPIQETAARIRHIEKSGWGLLGIVEDLTDFMTLQQGMPAPADVNVNVRESVLHEWEMLDNRQDMREAKINVFTDRPEQTVMGNPYFIRKAIAAVLSNAVRFTEKLPSVRVRLEPASRDFYKISIEDNGLGIAPEERADVLAPFFQSQSTRVLRHEGLGLGLAIANSVMTHHRGKLEISDAPSGRGTLVELYFPYLQQAPKK
jgi:two-component system, sensor histidine kinase and response regulator